MFTDVPSISYIGSFDEALLMEWEPPTGVEPIIGYLIYYKKQSETTWNTIGVSKLPTRTYIPELDNENLYEIKIKAFNYTYVSGYSHIGYGTPTSVQGDQIAVFDAVMLINLSQTYGHGAVFTDEAGFDALVAEIAAHIGGYWQGVVNLPVDRG